MSDVHPVTRALLATIMHSTEPMVLTDPHADDHPMIGVNAAFTALTGYSEAETVGRNCRFLQGEGTDLETPARIRRCLAGPRGCIEWIVNYRRDGSMFWNLLFLSPVFDADGNLLHFFGNQRDITKGHPAGLPGYAFGKADMPPESQAEFDALVRGIVELSEEESSRALERIVDAARRLNEVTTQLAPAPWEPPSP